MIIQYGYLGNPVSLLDFKGCVGMVEENHAEGPAVVFVDDAGTDVNEALGSEAGPGVMVISHNSNERTAFLF
jgi:hypothetical protein